MIMHVKAATAVKALPSDPFQDLGVQRALRLEEIMDPETASGAQDCAPEPKSLGPTLQMSSDAGSRLAGTKSMRSPKSPDLEELPPPGVVRWVIRRKAQVVAAVQAGAITVDEVCSRYSVSVEEFESWKRLFERHGVYGLRTTRSQLYRADEPSKG
jgi:hypothetical protein